MAALVRGGESRRREGLDGDVDLERDRELVERAQSGDRSAFDDLYRRYRQRLYRFCLRRLHDAHEAEDVTQEAFSRAWRALSTFDGARSFYPWLSVIAAHLCTDVFRKGYRSTPVAEFHQRNVASTEDDAEELVLRAVDTDLVAKAFERLSERHKRVLRLREGSEWSYQQIADHEGLATTAVETLLWRARQALKREFVTLARAEDRIGAWIGAAVSLAVLRRLLRAPLHALRRATSLGPGGAASVGSAAAFAAVVVASTLGGPVEPIAALAPVPSAIAAPSTHEALESAVVSSDGTSTEGGSVTSGAAATKAAIKGEPAPAASAEASNATQSDSVSSNPVDVVCTSGDAPAAEGIPSISPGTVGITIDDLGSPGGGGIGKLVSGPLAGMSSAVNAVHAVTAVNTLANAVGAPSNSVGAVAISVTNALTGTNSAVAAVSTPGVDQGITAVPGASVSAAAAVIPTGSTAPDPQTPSNSTANVVGTGLLGVITGS